MGDNLSNNSEVEVDSDLVVQALSQHIAALVLENAKMSAAYTQLHMEHAQYVAKHPPIQGE